MTTTTTWEAPQGMAAAPITATQEEATTQQGQGQKSLQSQGLCCSAQRPPSPCPLAHSSHLKSASAPGPALSSLRGMSSGRENFTPNSVPALLRAEARWAALKPLLGQDFPGLTPFPSHRGGGGGCKPKAALSPAERHKQHSGDSPAGRSPSERTRLWGEGVPPSFLAAPPHVSSRKTAYRTIPGFLPSPNSLGQPPRASAT